MSLLGACYFTSSGQHNDFFFYLSPCRAIGLIKKFEMNQLNYRLSHPVAALQTSLTKDMDKYSRIRFDYASFDAQVFGKQPLMGTNQDQEMSHFPDCKSSTFYLTQFIEK